MIPSLHNVQPVVEDLLYLSPTFHRLWVVSGRLGSIVGGRCDRSRLVSRTSSTGKGSAGIIHDDAWFHTVPLRESAKFSTIFEVVTHYRDSLL